MRLTVPIGFSLSIQLDSHLFSVKASGMYPLFFQFTLTSISVGPAEPDRLILTHIVDLALPIWHELLTMIWLIP